MAPHCCRPVRAAERTPRKGGPSQYVENCIFFFVTKLLGRDWKPQSRRQRLLTSGDALPDEKPSHPPKRSLGATPSQAHA